MDKLRKAVLFFCIYFLIFWIGLKSGEGYYRMKTNLEEQKARLHVVPAPALIPLKSFYIVEKHDHGTYSTVSFSLIDEKDPVMHFLFNEKLRPLLKLRDLQIYTKDGERIY